MMPTPTEDSRYYAMSVVLGTVALSYGSVPMYKMVHPEPSDFNRHV